MVEVRHARSATRHRISRARSRHVVENTSIVLAESAPSGSTLRDERLVFLGPDDGGELLEVMAIETDHGGLLIIHAQPIRSRSLKILKGGL